MIEIASKALNPHDLALSISVCRKLSNSWHCICRVSHQICIDLLTSQSLNIYSRIKTSSK